MLNQPHHFHFLGICGTAMGSVAAALKECGFDVTGSDENVYPPMSTFLEKKNIKITSGYDANHIPEKADILVIGNAIKRGNPEAEAVLNRKLYYLSLPEVLKNFFLRGKRNLVVTGTHGKTTTTSLLAWIFESSGKNPNYMIGGLPGNLGQGARFTKTAEYNILEGDEYDTAFFDKRSKFVHYMPELVIVNNIEFDHADIFKDIDAIKLSFQRMLNIVPSEGVVLLNADDEHCADIGKTCPAPVLRVGFSEDAERCITNCRYDENGSSFTLLGESFQIPQIGEFNVRNAAMAASAAHFYKIPLADIKQALASFQGVQRRQQVRGEVNGITVVDDFGHHPTAIRQTLEAMRYRYPNRRLWAIFEPRSNTTRRSVFQKILPEALSHADAIALAQIARLEQIPENERLNPERLVADLKTLNKPAFYESDADGIVARLQQEARSGDVLIVFSNGGFDGIHEKLLAALA